jgi:predicted secreted protein
LQTKGGGRRGRLIAGRAKRARHKAEQAGVAAQRAPAAAARLHQVLRGFLVRTCIMFIVALHYFKIKTVFTARLD